MVKCGYVMKHKNIFLVGLAMVWASGALAMECKASAKAVVMNAATKALFNDERVPHDIAKKLLKAVVRIKKADTREFLLPAVVACLFRFDIGLISQMLDDPQDQRINPLAVNEFGESPLFALQWENDKQLMVARVKILINLGVPVITRPTGGHNKGCTILEAIKLQSRLSASLGFKERCEDGEWRLKLIKTLLAQRNQAIKNGTLVGDWYKIEEVPSDKELDAACEKLETAFV